MNVKEPAGEARPAGRALPVMNEPAAARPRAAAAAAHPSSRARQGDRGVERQGRRRASPRSPRTSRWRSRSAGSRVGIMDADIYGPNIPRMMGVNEPPPVINEKIMPLEAHGVKIMSLGFLIERDQPAIWRGPIVMKIVNQFLRRRRVGAARLLHRRHAAGHRRRAAVARAGDAGARRHHRHDAAGSGRRRRAARREDVRARERARCSASWRT